MPLKRLKLQTKVRRDIMKRKSENMRKAVGDALHKLMEQNKNIYFIAADMGRQVPVIEPDFPERFIEVGVAEQNMIGIAAGLAYSGKIVYTNTMACFTSMRACEQVRTDCCYPNLNVKMFGSGRGLCYGSLGTSHHATEDIGILRSMANITILLPADAREAGKMVAAVAKYDGPTYIGLARIEEPVVYEEDYDFQIGKAITLRQGNDVTLIATGTMVVQALDAAQILAQEQIEARVINMHTIKPLDNEAVVKAAKETGAIVTAEDHNISTGLGAAVAEAVVENCPVPMKRIGIPDVYCAIGYFEELMEKYKMSPPHIAEATRKVIGRKS